MKTFLQHSKDQEREEFERQMNHFFDTAKQYTEKANSLKDMGDIDGYHTFMAKHHHAITQGEFLKKALNEEKSPAWQRKAGKNPEGGLNRKGIASYRRENPGSKLSMAVTTPPSKLKAGSKAANRRKSFCARMGGMPGPMKDEKGRPTRKALSLRKWNC
jgi:hypothetical protein